MEQPVKKKQRTENHRDELEQLQNSLLKRCLCHVPESSLYKPFINAKSEGSDGRIRFAMLSEWRLEQILEFLSALQLLFDLAIKQNMKGIMCTRIADICNILAQNEHGIINQIIDLSYMSNRFVLYAASRVLASFFIITRENVEAAWLETLTQSLVDTSSPSQMLFTLDIVTRVIEHKDTDGTHPEEAEAYMPPINCNKITISESFDSTEIKAMCVRALESKWITVVTNFHDILSHYTPQYESVVITFLHLWETIISVKANLSIIDTKLFYSELDHLVRLLISVPGVIWRHMLNLFNEVLCYGSTLALQDGLPEEPCSLAHLVLRAVKDSRLLEALPYRDGSGRFGGGTGDGDRPLLQKMVLLVLKSVAVTVRETRSDSSDSSLGSEAEDLDEDMAMIERSIREVLRQLDQCVKALMPFHPDMPLSQWVVQIFQDQDDFLIEGMVCCLDVAVGLFYRGSPQNERTNLSRMLSPTLTFVQFIHTVTHDSSVLLDLLVSNETCFLLYLLRFLKYVRRNWAEFVACCGGELDNTMGVLVRLKMSIDRLVKKALFPYNINPVLRLLEKCESFYENPSIAENNLSVV
ncbi:protein lines [Pseudomyrmex gracilis]|uniref:protein lines n=1 Tax=Pseudomyrmex gracilis TaxID=219809 RepID=UPI000995899C|nr:protein lines [Pseudomyrmex gracilis]XP_020285057.1 protein lines [Pseudomyrmex gracilis]XP_020285058.1 protein lines [Pseudomyrmex gracilis]XP_020285059.1 protein lines [Pseudomyrmex gracilis]